MLIPIGVLRYEIEVEQGVVVYELVCRLLGLLADGSKLADEPALLQFLQRFRKFSIVCEFRRFSSSSLSSPCFFLASAVMMAMWQRGFLNREA